LGNPIIITEAGEQDIPAIIRLAGQIWPSTYKTILLPDQIKYMMDRFYSISALKDQMVSQGDRFLLGRREKEWLGFTSFSSPNLSGDYKLQKLYVLPSCQGQGIGRQLIHEVIRIVREKGAPCLDLNVNRLNAARNFYEKLGFFIIESLDIPIGNGFFMNDFVMRKVFDTL